MSSMPYIGENLRYYRDRAYLTQKELGEMAGLSPDTISKLESDRATPRASTVRRLAEILNVKPDALTGFDEDIAAIRF